MIYIRKSMWETNSSTMNQIIIASPNENKRDNFYSDKIIFHTWLPYGAGDMVNNYAEKANIVYCLINEIAYAKSHEPLKDIEQHPESYDTDEMIKMLIDVLKRHNIEAMIDTSPHWNIAPDELDNFGLSGITDNAFTSLFDDPDILDRFIFDNDSYFTFGFENMWPSYTIGYTKAPIPEGAKEIHI